jgi:hypothetical protein
MMPPLRKLDLTVQPNEAEDAVVDIGVGAIAVVIVWAIVLLCLWWVRG